MSSTVSFGKLKFVKKLKALGYILLFTLLLSGLIFVTLAYIKPKAAGIYVESNPISTVYINGEDRGSTPLRENLSPEDVVLRLVPIQEQDILEPLETKITLVSGVETVVRHDFSTDTNTSATEIISFVKTDRESTVLSIVTTPEGARLLINGRERAFSPYRLTNLNPGEHNILISELGYKDRVVKLRTHKGYELILFINLAQETVEVEEVVVEPEVVVQPQVRIRQTGTGFLRVRSNPSMSGLELGRVVPGEVYNLVTMEEQDGWYNIEFNPGETGWISAEYAEVLETEKE